MFRNKRMSVDMSVQSRISNLYLQDDLADVYFIFPGHNSERIPGHKVIIATASHVLKELMCTNQVHVEQESTIRIDGCKPDIFKLLLR